VSKSVLIIATLDTKGPEAAYIRDGLNRLGIKTTVIDTGILGEPLGITPDISHEDLAIFGGITLHELQNSGTRGRAVERMRTFVIEKVKELHSKGEVLGAIGSWCTYEFANWCSKISFIAYCIWSSRIRSTCWNE